MKLHILYWLVVWNMNFMTFHILGIHHPNWRTHIFRGAGIPPTRYRFMGFNSSRKRMLKMFWPLKWRVLACLRMWCFTGNNSKRFINCWVNWIHYSVKNQGSGMYSMPNFRLANPQVNFFFAFDNPCFQVKKTYLIHIHIQPSDGWL